MPLWLAAGFADYLCHRGSDIEHTSGFKELLLHLLQFAEMAVPIMAVMFLEVNALIILLMSVSFKPLTQEARQRGAATIQARANAFAQSMVGTIAALEAVTASTGPLLWAL